MNLRHSIPTAGAFLAVLWMAGAAAAQQPLRWPTNVEAAVKQAQRTELPIMFYVVSRSDDRPEDLEDDQQKTFRDPRVIAMAQRFICARMSRSRYENELRSWQLSPQTNLAIVVVTPEGEKLDLIGAAEIARAETFLSSMQRVFESYRTKVFDEKVKPILEKEDADAKDRRAAFQRVESFLITEADELLVNQLKEDKVKKSEMKSVYEALAAISTPAAIDELFARALEDKLAAKALEDATPEAAENLLQYVGGGDPAAHALAYSMAAEVTKLKQPKPDRFWTGKNESAKTEEIHRLKNHVKQVAERWKETYGRWR